MILLQQLQFSIEESHSANDGHAQGGGEKQFVEHHFLLVSVPGLRQKSASVTVVTSLNGVKAGHYIRQAQFHCTAFVLSEKQLVTCRQGAPG